VPFSRSNLRSRDTPTPPPEVGTHHYPKKTFHIYPIENLTASHSATNHFSVRWRSSLKKQIHIICIKQRCNPWVSKPDALLFQTLPCDTVHENHKQDLWQVAALANMHCKWVWPCAKNADTGLALVIPWPKSLQIWLLYPILPQCPAQHPLGNMVVSLLQVHKTYVDWMVKLPWPPQ